MMGVTAAIPTMGYAYLVLAGGVLALIGGLGLLATKLRSIGYLLPVGGLLAIVGAGWGLSDISSAMAGIVGITGITVSIGYGIYACLIGGIMALIGSLALRGK